MCTSDTSYIVTSHRCQIQSFFSNWKMWHFAAVTQISQGKSHSFQPFPVTAYQNLYVTAIFFPFRYFGFVTKHPSEHRFACHTFMSEYSTEPVAKAIGWGALMNVFIYFYELCSLWSLHFSCCSIKFSYLVGKHLSDYLQITWEDHQVERYNLLSKSCLGMY